MASALNIPLAAYLRSAAAKPFRYGDCDCVLFACDWVLHWTGCDPAAPWRGYQSSMGARRIIVAAGGFLEVVSDGMARAGFAEDRSPCTGDVGVIDNANGRLMAIKTPIGWAVKLQSGIACVSAAPIKAWTIKCP